MSGQHQSAAKTEDTTPDLEIVEGEGASVVETGEIEALLDEMAKQNEEAASEEAASIEGSSEDEPEQVASLTEAEESVTDVEPQQVLVDPAPQELEAGPSFTMEDVLRAASESTSFSVDEIQNFERNEELADEALSERASDSGDVDVDANADLSTQSSEIESIAVESHPAKPAVNESAVSAKRTAASDERGIVERLTSNSWLPSVGIAVVGILAALFFVNSKVSGLESKLASRQDSIEKSVLETTESLKSLDERFASIDRSIQREHGGKGTGVATEQRAAKPGEHKEATVHGNTAVKGPSSGSGDPHKGEPKEDGVSKAEHSKATHEAGGKHEGHDQPVSPKGPNGDHYDAGALVEGFKSTKLLIAKNASSHSPRSVKSKPHGSGTDRTQKGKGHRSKSVHANSTPRSSGNSVRVYGPNGELVDRVVAYRSTGH